MGYEDGPLGRQTRRGFLGAAATTTGALVAGAAMPGAAGADTSCSDLIPAMARAPKGGRIDLHAHVIPPDYRVVLLASQGPAAGGYPTPVWAPERAIAFMDSYGIQMQVLSVSDPGTTFMSDSDAKTDDQRAAVERANALAQLPGVANRLGSPASDRSVEAKLLSARLVNRRAGPRELRLLLDAGETVQIDVVFQRGKRVAGSVRLAPVASGRRTLHAAVPAAVPRTDLIATVTITNQWGNTKIVRKALR
jgi:hypothetical protein